MDEAHNGKAVVSAHPDTTAPRSPRGFAVRLSPGAWADVFDLPDGRRGVVLGCCAEPAEAERLRSQTREALRHNLNPVSGLNSVDGLPLSALCAVIDANAVAYSTYGATATAAVVPDTRPASPAPDQPVVCDLAPGATVILSTAPLSDTAAVLGSSAALHPDQVAEQAISQTAGAPAATVVYRHPPEPMHIALFAVPSNLAVSRVRLREWLAEAGVDPQSCADVLLAVGEATANATEHSVLGAHHEVRLTVDAALIGNSLRLTVTDDGAWKPATPSQGRRGHGVQLMSALVDSVELTATPGGTTVAMLKELP